METGLKTHVLPAGAAATATAAGVLAEGGLVAFPTETVYGLGADAGNAAATIPGAAPLSTARASAVSIRAFVCMVSSAASRRTVRNSRSGGTPGAAEAAKKGGDGGLGDSPRPRGWVCRGRCQDVGVSTHQCLMGCSPSRRAGGPKGQGRKWSEWQDSNLRPPRPERGALPD